MIKLITHNILLLFSIIFLTSSLSAQITINDTLLSDSETAISIQHLNGKIELTKRQIKSIQKKIVTPQSISEIEVLLPEYQNFINEQTQSYKNFKKSHPNKQKIINYINKWGSYTAYLKTWQATINKYLDKNIIRTTDLKKQEKKWQLTLDNVRKIGAEYEVRNNVLSTKMAITKLILEINKQNNHYLSLENKILLQKENIDAVVDYLEEWKLSEEFSILTRRHPVIWVKETEQKNDTEHFDGWLSFKENVWGIYTYLQSPENDISTHLVLITLMALWLWRLRVSYKNNTIRANEKRLTQSKSVLVNHFTPAILFTALIMSMGYFTHTPNLLMELMLLLAMITTMPLIQPYMHDKFKGLIYFLIVLFIIDTIKSYVWYSSFLYQIYLFIETLIFTAIAVKMIYPYLKTRRLDLNGLSTFLVKISPIVYVLMGIAFFSNIFGYTNLTDLMLKVTIKGAVVIVVLYGMLVILGSIATASLNYYFSNLGTYDPKYRQYLEKKAHQLVHLLAYMFFVAYFLHIIDMYDQVILWVMDTLSDPISFGVINFTLGNVFSFLLILFGSYAITSFISEVVDGGVLNFLHLQKGVPTIISVVLRYFLLAFAFIIAMSSIGINLSQFNLMAGALGLGIGFGLQNIISNFISGVILIFERPIQTDDVVEVGALMGTVRKIGVRASNVRTFDGAEVVVPNSNLISNEVINWTLSDNVKRMEIKIGAAYGTDLQQVVDILNDVAQNHEQTLKDPKPNALFDNFGDSSLNFRLLYWVPVEFGISSKSEISIEVYKRFTTDGIKIPFPQRDMHLKSTDLEALSNSNEK